MCIRDRLDTAISSAEVESKEDAERYLAMLQTRDGKKVDLENRLKEESTYVRVQKMINQFEETPIEKSRSKVRRSRAWTLNGVTGLKKIDSCQWLSQRGNYWRVLITQRSVKKLKYRSKNMVFESGWVDK